jgi:plastocyanin
MTEFSRRTVLRSVGAIGLAGSLAGCSGGGGSATERPGDVVAGPDGETVFEPEEYTASVGETVEWYFASPAHNVSAVPDHSDEVTLPDGAAPFASYGPDEGRGTTEPEGTTFEHTFETPGTYTYVCIPHVRVGMVGTVVVEG